MDLLHIKIEPKQDHADASIISWLSYTQIGEKQDQCRRFVSRCS